MTAETRPWIFLSAILLGFLIFTQVAEVKISLKPQFSSAQKLQSTTNTSAGSIDTSALQAATLPADGVKLPIKWGNLGKQMVDTGVISEVKFRELFNNELTKEQGKMLAGNWDGPVIINKQNGRFLLDMLWALGLGNKNEILENGEMVDEQYGGVGNFASTGGWTLAKGEAMDHYSKHEFVTLTADQQALVDKVSRGIYRPCCGNSTHFPDCNHGMAMLGLLELMAAQGVGKDQMYKTALAVNGYWFLQTYLDLATYFKEQGQEWGKVDPALVLGQEYSSAQGYQATRGKIKSLPQANQSGTSC